MRNPSRSISADTFRFESRGFSHCWKFHQLQHNQSGTPEILNVGDAGNTNTENTEKTKKKTEESERSV